MVEINNSGNFKEMELLRGIAILSVIVLHATKSFFLTEINSILVLFSITCAIVLFGVPLFIFISGFLLSKKYNNNYAIIDFYKKRFKIIIPPFLIFSCIYLIIFYILAKPFEFMPENLYVLIVRIITATSYYHLWYFGLIIQFYLIFPVVDKIVNKYENNLFTLLVISILIQLIWTLGRIYLFSFIDNFKNLGIIYILINVPLQYSFLSHIAYFMLGLYISKNYERITKTFQSNRTYFYIIPFLILLIILQSYFWIFGTLRYGAFYNIPITFHSIMNLTGMFLYITMAIFFLKISLDLINQKNIIEWILTKFGQYSFGIYLIHAGIITLTTITLNLININYNNLSFFIICIVITAIMSLIITYIINFLPYHELLIGKIRYWDNSKELYFKTKLKIPEQGKLNLDEIND